jgi:tRNA G18 (ribose-2'-O)-methylase SpoU
VVGGTDIIEVDDPRDERLADFRELKDRPLRQAGGKLVAESEVVVRKLLTSSFEVCSLLVAPTRLETLATLLRPGVPVYVGSPALLEQVVGFHVHRGCLAVAMRPERVVVPESARLVVVLEDLVDMDNLGSMVRNAAAFGADAVILSPRCADPYYRKAVRTSAGHVFTLPIVRAERWPEDLAALRPRFTVLGASLAPGAKPLAELRRPERVAVVLGSEGPGLTTGAAAACHALVQIPMAARADSLNVSVAGAVTLYHLTQVAPPVAG